MHFENEYLINFLYNMDQGFITLDSSGILFINRSMCNLIENYEMLMRACKEHICELGNINSERDPFTSYGLFFCYSY